MSSWGTVLCVAVELAVLPYGRALLTCRRQIGSRCCSEPPGSS